MTQNASGQHQRPQQRTASAGHSLTSSHPSNYMQMLDTTRHRTESGLSTAFTEPYPHTMYGQAYAQTGYQAYQPLSSQSFVARQPMVTPPQTPRGQDTRVDKKPTLYKTELCRSFEETSQCRYGDKCQFAHSVDEVRGIDRHPKYKSELCKTFWEKGSCPYGKRCCFVHTEKDARRMSEERASPPKLYSSYADYNSQRQGYEPITPAEESLEDQFSRLGVTKPLSSKIQPNHNVYYEARRDTEHRRDQYEEREAYPYTRQPTNPYSTPYAIHSPTTDDHFTYTSLNDTAADPKTRSNSSSSASSNALPLPSSMYQSHSTDISLDISRPSSAFENRFLGSEEYESDGDVVRRGRTYSSPATMFKITESRRGRRLGGQNDE